MKKQENLERFYEWMKSVQNKYIGDNVKMQRAFEIVALNDIEVVGYEIVKPE